MRDTDTILAGVDLDLDLKRQQLICDECGQHPLKIDVAGPDGVRTGDQCQRFSGPRRCEGTLRHFKG
jgi:hypothetical protein